MQETLTNGGKNLGVSLNIYNPTNRTINSTTVYVEFPSISAPTGSISLTGPQTNLASSGGETSLAWLISSIQPGHSVQLGYTVSNVTVLQLLLGPLTNIASTFKSTAPTFTLISAVPTNLTVGENSNVIINGLYEGAYQPDITLSVSSNSLSVASPYKIIAGVAQEQIINTTFAIVPNAIRNTTIMLAVKGQGINQSYSIPIVISPKSTALTRFIKEVEKDIGDIVVTALAIILLVAALQFATEELPKSIRVEKGSNLTSNKAMRKHKYDQVFEVLSKADDKVTRMRMKGVPTKWGLFTHINKRNVRIINASGHLSIYTRGPTSNKVREYLKSNDIAFVELMVR